jgi:serine/threonine-protein kinase
MPTFGRYEIQDKLGEGAMGVVYRARDTAIGREVALKMLSAEYGAEEELIQRFLREAETIGRLSHPNIVTVYDMGDAEGRLYMAMELLEGEDMRSLIERRAPIALADRVRILHQICAGLSYAHSRAVVHRDIKPANIIVTSAGRVKLLDFGLARMATRATMTRAGVILGTPDYMAPEQATGRATDQRSDMFSAGSVFYEFLCGVKPFRAKTLHGVLYQIIQEQPEPMLSVNPELPARLAALVAGMMRKDPERRFAAMEEVQRQLGEIHLALRRSRGRSALPGAVGPPPEELRGRLREHLAKGRAHLEGDRLGPAVSELNEALVLDPANDEAADMLWQVVRKMKPAKDSPVREPPDEKRVLALLAKAAPGTTEDQARSALLELALLAPDDMRFADLMRERATRTRQ